MKPAFARLTSLLLEGIASESVARALLLAGAILSGSLALANQARVISWTIAASLFATAVLSYAKWLWEYRKDNYRIIYRENTFRLKDDGRSVEYEVRLRIRSTQKNLRWCTVRFSWSGETDLSSPGVYDAIGSGFTIQTPEQTSKYINFKFEFNRPIGRCRTRTVGVRFHLVEPARSYTPYIGFDPAPWSWSPFSRLTTKLIWEDRGLVNN